MQSETQILTEAMIRTSLMLAVFLMWQSQAWAKPVKTLRGNNAVMVAETVPSGSCTLSSVKRLATQYLNENSGAEVLWVGIFTDKDVASDVAMGKGRSETTFQQWRNLYTERNASTRGQVCAELVRIGNRASLRFLGKSGKTVDVPITTPGAFHWEVDGHSLELVHVGFAEVYSGKPQLQTHLYFKSKQKVDLKLGRQLTRRLSATLKGVVLVAHVREDDWFLSSSVYPWVNPFVPDSALPTWEAYKAGAELYCETATGPKPCMEHVGALVPQQ